MKKRFTVALLSLCAALALLPTAAAAADTEETIYVGGTELTGSADAPAYALTAEDGAVTAEGADAENYSIKWDGQTLTLDDATITQGAHESVHGDAAVYCETGFKIELVGENTVKGPEDDYETEADYSYGIYTGGDLTVGGSGSLNAAGGTVMSRSYYVSSCGISAAGSINIRGGTVTASGGTAVSDESHAWSNGLESTDGDITVSGGTVTATGGQATALSAVSYGIEADGDITVNGGEVTATGGKAAGSSNDSAKSYGIYSYDGQINISNGITTATGGQATGRYAESYGIYSYGEPGGININGGTVTAEGGNVSAADGSDLTFLYSGGIQSSYGSVTVTSGEVEATGGTVTGENAKAYSCGIEAEREASVSGGTVKAAGGQATGAVAESFGIDSYDITTVSGGQVTASGGWATSTDEEEYVYSCGIYSDGVTISGGTVKATGTLAMYEGEGYDSHSYGIEAYSDVIIKNAAVFAGGDEANYSAGIFIDGDITIESGSVQTRGGRAVNHTDPDAATSSGIRAYGSVTVNGGEVIAAVGLTEHGSADGVYALGDININGGSVTATGASYPVDGVEPQYSGGIFSESGDVTITGKDTVVNASGGCARDGISAIAAKAGDIVIKGGSVRADGAYGAYIYEGLGNGLSALKDIDDGTGGNIIISGGTIAATGYTDSLYYEAELIVRPGNGQITVSALDDWTVNEDTWDMDWDKMAADAAELEGSPFTEETVIARALTEGKLYFGAAAAEDDPTDPDNPDDPSNPDDPNNPDDPGNTDDPNDPTDPSDSDEQDGDADKDDSPQTYDGGLILPLLLVSGTAAAFAHMQRRKRAQ